MAPDHVLTDAATRDALVPRIAAAIRDMFGEDPSQSPDYGRIVSAAHFDRVTGLIDPDEVAIGGESG